MSLIGAVDQGTGSSRLLVGTATRPPTLISFLLLLVHVSRARGMYLIYRTVLKVFNEQFELVSKHQEEIKQVFPKEG
jgi:hypothetical protein